MGLVDIAPFFLPAPSRAPPLGIKPPLKAVQDSKLKYMKFVQKSKKTNLKFVQKSNESKDMEIGREGWQVEPKTKNHHKPSKGKVLDSGKSRNLDESTPVILVGGIRLRSPRPALRLPRVRGLQSKKKANR